MDKEFHQVQLISFFSRPTASLISKSLKGTKTKQLEQKTITGLRIGEILLYIVQKCLSKPSATLPGLFNKFYHRVTES
jgi:hypothetical protein